MSNTDIFFKRVRDMLLEKIDDRQIRHVYPTFGREHITNKRDECWCCPTVEFVEGGAIIIHEVEQ